MKKTIYVCRHCKNYCDTETCYFCDISSDGVLKDIEINKEHDIRLITDTLNKLNRSSFDVLLSLDGDGPAEIEIVTISFEALLIVLQTSDFVFNNIVSASNKGQLQKCLGVALLTPLKYKYEEVKGVFIFTEYS